MDAKLIVSPALHTMACSVIIAHNHPSGKLEPSDMDLKITKKVKAALDLIDVKLLDHFIVTENGYYSFAEEGDL
jgi:DNA repair protein RadC